MNKKMFLVFGLLINLTASAADFTLQVNPANSSVGVPQLKTGLAPISCTSGQQIKWDSASSVWTCVNFKTPTLQKFGAGSGTYITPADVKYLKVKLIGGGGGGGGAGAGNNSGQGGPGGTTTFGTSLLTATGGLGGRNAAVDNVGGVGGSPTVGAGALGSAFYGSTGSNASARSEQYAPGGTGAASLFSGGGSGATNGGGQSATPNSGAGGGGGSMGATAGLAGHGGGAGAYIEAIIPNPAATYPFSVGAAGTGGPANGGSAGGYGAAGVILVEEYYQ